MGATVAAKADMLHYYTLPNIKGEGWAHIAINTETGFFAAVSDWGNFSYLWTHPGMEFRKFLTELQPDYLHSKLMMGRPDRAVFSGSKTVENIRQAIEDKNKEEGRWAFYHEEMDTLKALGPDPEKYALDVWESETHLTDVWEYVVYLPEPQCRSFCEKVWPRFKKLLLDELEEEKVTVIYGTRGKNKSVDTPNATVLTMLMTEEDKAGLPLKMTGPDRNG
jgi:hypothetical protein